MLISAAAFSAMNVLVKLLHGFGALEIVFFRSITTLIICLFYLWWKQIPPLGRNRPWLLIRGITGTISMSLFFYAIKIMPLGSAVALRYLSPIFGIILALIFLGERVRPIQWLFFLMAFSGVILLNGFDGRISGFALGVILTSAFFSGVVFMVIRKLGNGEHPLVIITYFMVVGTLVGFLGAVNNWVQPVGKEWWLLLAMGVLGLVGQLFITIAVQIEVANKVAPLKYVEAIFILVLSYFFFQESYSLLAMLGIGLIVVGNLLNGFLPLKEP